MKRFFLGFILVIALPLKSWAVPITVSLEASSTDVFVGDIFTLNILADIPDPVLGWGLDVNFDSALVNQTMPPVIGPAWFAAVSPDGDGLAGLVFPTPVSGTGILLASLSFEAIDAGTVLFSAGISPLDLNEGFPLLLQGSFAEVVFNDLAVTINVPEPGTLLLFVVGFIVLLGCRLNTDR